jgi:hypothetical protein
MTQKAIYRENNLSSKIKKREREREKKIHLHSRVSSAVKNLAGLDRFDDCHS